MLRDQVVPKGFEEWVCVLFLLELTILLCHKVDVSGEVVNGHLGTLFVHDLEMELLHGLLELIKGFGLDMPQFLRR